MKNLSIIIIGVYYGTFPEWIEYWLRSCADNPTIDYLIVTDIKRDRLPQNVKLLDMSMEQLKSLAEKKLEIKIAFEKAYKACDLKPCYGKIFEDYIFQYDYWGHCDFDLIFGDIRGFVQRYEMEKYDKFLPLGHLALYRNTEKCNSYYKLGGSKCGDYKTVFASADGFAFDETDGIYSIYEANHLSMFSSRVFAEIKTYHKRFRLKSCDKNYRHQAFYYENGKVFRAYEKENKIMTEEFVYIHFRRKFSANEKIRWDELGCFYIGPDGFNDKENGIPGLDVIEKVNHNPGILKETWETILFCTKNISNIGSKINNEVTARKMNQNRF